MANENGKLSRAINIILIALLTILIGWTAYNTQATATTCERVARLEAQYENIREDLREIKQALGLRALPKER